MTKSTMRSTLVVAVLLAGAGFFACRSTSEEAGGDDGSGGETQGTGGKGGKGGSGGKAAGGAGGKVTSGSGGEQATGGTPATGGTKGEGGAAGGATGEGGAAGGATGEGGAAGGATGEGGAAGGTKGEGGAAGGMSGGEGGAAGGSSGGAVLACWADPKVIHICHQLENACENCGPLKGTAPPKNKLAQPCFDLVEKAYKGMATDEDCVKFAAANDCTVDNVATTGNVCGSLDCSNPACNGIKSGNRNCAQAQQWGDSSMCNVFYAKCPCK